MDAKEILDDAKAADNSRFDDPEFIFQIRRDMLKFATLQLRDHGLAEDAVQEALIAAHKNVNSFNRKSAFKTWVFAILKNKVVDILRKDIKEVTFSHFFEEDSDDISDVLFNHRGFWNSEEQPADWSEPMESVKNAQFWQIFEACVNVLPDKLSRIFMMREFVELESGEICQILNISTSNFHVMLYRARLRLQACLEKKWF